MLMVTSASCSQKSSSILCARDGVTCLVVGYLQRKGARHSLQRKGARHSMTTQSWQQRLIEWQKSSAVAGLNRKGYAWAD